MLFYKINLSKYYKNPPLIRAVFYLDSQFQQLFISLTIRTELDLKSECLFHISSVVTNLVTSLKFQPIRCATTLFHFGWAGKGYVATQFILISSTAESTATSGYVVAPERSGQSEA